MTVKKITITDDWTAISLIGESGTCWLQRKPNRGQVVLSHSDSGTGGLEDDVSYPLVKPSPDILPITADNVDDIFYAKCIETDENAVVISDVV